MTIKITRLFKNGSNQAVRIPKDMAFDSQEVRLYKEGNKLIIEPVQPTIGLAALLGNWQPLDEEFPEIEDLPIEPEGIFDQ